MTRTITHTLKRAHSKVLESGWLSRFYTPRIVTIISALSIGFLTLMTGCEHFQHPSGPFASSFLHKKKETSALEILLNALSLEKRDLGIHRSLPSKDPFLLNKVPYLLTHPLQTIPFANNCVTAFNRNENSLSSILNISANLMEIEINPIEQEKVSLPESFKRIPPSPLRQAIEILYPALTQGKKIFDEAFDHLNKEEIDFTKKEIESLLFSEQKIEKLLRNQHQRRLERAFSLASKIDRRKMLKAGYLIASAVDQALKVLDGMKPIQEVRLLDQGIITLPTPLGEILIGGYGDNHYTGKMPLLLIDLGGNDRYYFEEYSPFSVIIDLSGNDQYESSENAWLGAGVLGIGFLIDLKGDDLYQGKNLSFGAGFLGVGFLMDKEGNDKYISGIFSQGAGAMGLGILCDHEGDDFYKTALCSQGFGFVGGGGFLLDYRGNDTFYSGGMIPDDREKSGAFQTFSQGFGFGIRPFASGGIGILYNGEGDDSYEGSYFAQGSAYWLSIGMLIDRKGNDCYQARRYAQGAGIHWAIGILMDYEGNDRYTSWGVSQGCGHDRSVGILWDGKGDDRYVSEWLSQGVGNDSGQGLLIDEKGNDTYEAGTDKTQGSANYDEWRNEGSIGLLVDGGGEDTFSGQGKEKGLWKSGYWGGGIAYKGYLPTIWKEPFKTERQSQSMKIPPHPFPPPRGGRVREGVLMDEDKAWEGFILPEIEGPLANEDDWKKAAQALAKQAPSVIPALLKYLEIKDVTVQRTLEETFRRIGESDPKEIHHLIEKDEVEKTKKRFLLFVLGEIGNPESKGIFLKWLKDEDPSVQSMALRGLYKLKETPSLEDAFRLSKSGLPEVRKYLCLSLQTSQDSKWIPLLLGFRKDADFNVRFIASDVLKTF